MLVKQVIWSLFGKLLIKQETSTIYKAGFGERISVLSLEVDTQSKNTTVSSGEGEWSCSPCGGSERSQG